MDPGLGAVDGAVRQLAARIADMNDVSVTEADYAGHVIRVGLAPGRAAGATERVVSGVRAMSGVSGVAPAR